MFTFKACGNIFLSLPGGCRFQLARMEMKEGVKVLEHLKSEHQVLILYHLLQCGFNKLLTDVSMYRFESFILRIYSGDK